MGVTAGKEGKEMELRPGWSVGLDLDEFLLVE